MFCHSGTQTMDNSRICHCLLFHEHGKQNFVQPLLWSRKLLRYTHTWTKLHNEVMSWMSCTYVCHLPGPYLKQTQLLCVIWQDRLWAAFPSLSWFAVSFSRSIGMELDSERSIVWTFMREFSTCANLKCTYPFVQFKFSVYGHTYLSKPTYTCLAMQSH